MTAAPPTFSPTPHPVLELPDAARLALLTDGELIDFYAAREAAITQERSDPLNYGFEPPIWTVCDALLGLPWAEEDWKRRGWGSPIINQQSTIPNHQSARSFRESLGFEWPVDVLLILGGNRASKSQYAARCRARYIQWMENKIIWAFHSTLEMSVATQQLLDFHYMPASWQAKDIKTRWTYIAFKEKTGFTDSHFIAPGRGRVHYKAYAQGMDDALQGPEIDLATPDELVPADWIKELELRIATRSGKIIVTFTPREGYSDTVALFLEGALTVKESVAYLLPKDGGDPEPWNALGLTKEEFDHLWQVKRRNDEEKTNIAPLYPQSRPEEFGESEQVRKGESETGSPAHSLPCPPAREFETVPRIMRCSDPKRAVVFFHGRDNPFGNPKQVIRNTMTGTRDWILECNYGVARKTVGAAFKVFDWNIHTIAPEAIPPRADMTIINLWDPHGVARNYAGIWMGITPEHDYLFREWPGNYYIPDIGVPGRWAEPGNKRHPDGTIGPGQRSFGWHHWKYKKEIARLEQWPCYDAAADAEAVRAWDQWQPRAELVRERQMDSRFASVPIMSSEKPREQADRPRTLLTEYDDWGLTFQRTSGDSVNEGVHDIEAALDYNAQEPVSFHNKPRILISRDCVNTIFALQIWTGLEKDKGATAEWIGLLRYFYRGGFSYIGGERGEPEEEDNQWNEEGIYGR